MYKIQVLSFSNSEYAVALKYKCTYTILTSRNNVILIFHTIRTTNFTDPPFYLTLNNVHYVFIFVN